MLVPCGIISSWWFPVPSLARLYRFSDLCMIFLLKCNQLSFQTWRDKYFLRILFHLNLSDKIRQAAITVYFQVYLRSLPFAQPAYGSAIPSFWMYVGLYRNGCFVHRTTAQALVFDRRAGVRELGKGCSIVNIKQSLKSGKSNFFCQYLGCLSAKLHWCKFNDDQTTGKCVIE